MKKKKFLRKRKKINSLLDKAKLECEEAWKNACLRRDKGICQIHGENCLDLIIQVDHFRSRRHGMTFFMPENGTTVCRSLNLEKAMGWNNAAEKIGFVVLKREGESMVDFLLETSHQTKKWTLQELEDLKKKLNGMFL